MSNKQKRSEYWASVPKEKIGAEIMLKAENYRKYMRDSGFLEELQKSYDQFYCDTEIRDVDESLKAININHFANLIRHIHVMVTSQRPAWEVRAINTDSESQADTQLASGLLDYYMKEKRLEKLLSKATEQSLFLREGWISMGWDVSGGQVHGINPETGKPIYEGDVEFRNHTILDVIRDVSRKNMNHEWFILVDKKNKWDLAAKYPELADKIRGLSCDNKEILEYSLSTDQQAIEYNEDLIPIYELRHDRTEAMPNGRLTIVLDSEIVLFDGPLPFKNKYVFCVTPAEKADSPFGHSPAMDLLPIQDAFNMTVSAILTNQAANAVQNFKVPKGAAPKVTQVAAGLNIWEYDAKSGGELEPMNLLQTAPEVFKFAEYLVSQSELISGVNQISRGNAPAQMSGTAMALIQQQAIQFSSGVEMGKVILMEQVGTSLLELLQTFAVVPRIAMIAGKTKRSYMRSFKGEDLKGIGRVFVDSANPLTKAVSGRMEIAKDLLMTPNMIKTPEQYISVLTTGNLEPLYEHENGQLQLIRSENEWLMEGKPVNVVMTEDDALHVLEHSCVFNSPEAKENPQVMQATLAHIQLHIDQAKTKDPVLAGMLKQASFAPPPMPMPAPQGDPNAVPEVMDNTNPITQEAEQVGLPKPAQPPELAMN